jgi:F-type H+-transporting ATPase subunit a
VLSSLVPFGIPTPFMLLEVIVGVVQALVFSMLVLVYLTLATDAPHGDEHAHEEDELGEAHGIAGATPDPHTSVPI